MTLNYRCQNLCFGCCCFLSNSWMIKTGLFHGFSGSNTAAYQMYIHKLKIEQVSQETRSEYIKFKTRLVLGGIFQL